jgi:hypothetical protein
MLQGPLLAHSPTFDDIQGTVGTALTGAAQYTLKQYRNTGLVLPYMANGDFFTQIIQMPHRKKLGTAVPSVHLHWITELAVTGTIIFDWAWGFYNENGAVPVPNTLPNTGQTTISIAAADQYLPKISGIVSNIPAPTNETYSAILLVKVARNGGTFGNNNEIAIRYVDAHVECDRFGSRQEYTD